MSKSNIVSVHRQLARGALREARRRKEGRKPVGLSDKAIDYLIRQNPLAWLSRTAPYADPDLTVRPHVKIAMEEISEVDEKSS